VKIGKIVILTKSDRISATSFSFSSVFPDIGA